MSMDIKFENVDLITNNSYNTWVEGQMIFLKVKVPLKRKERKSI